MRAGGCNFQPAAPGHSRELATEADDLFAGIMHVLANIGAELDHRLVHFGFDLFFECDFAFTEDLLNMRAEFARFRINDLELFLNSKCEGVILGHAYLNKRNSKGRARWR